RRVRGLAAADPGKRLQECVALSLDARHARLVSDRHADRSSGAAAFEVIEHVAIRIGRARRVELGKVVPWTAAAAGTGKSGGSLVARPTDNTLSVRTRPMRARDSLSSVRQ